jgi:hypothetical protein
MGARGTDLHVVTTLVPRGPRGLWRSLARAAGVDDLHDEHDVVDLDALEGAHLGYLASLA